MSSFNHHLHRLLLDSGSSNPPESNGSHPRGPYSSETTFGTNMVIILVALLCALIFALGLNSIVRCAMRCSHRLSFDSSDQSSVRMASAGVKKSALGRIPVAVYHAELNIPASDCLICLGEFADGERVRVLPRCHHGFHVACIDTWLVAHSSCPTCRQSLLDQQLVGSDAVASFPGGPPETAIIVDDVS